MNDDKTQLEVVYIKGMKKPETCCDCELVVYASDHVWNDNGIETVGAWMCLLTGELIDNTKREDHCPLGFINFMTPNGSGNADYIKRIDVEAVRHGHWYFRDGRPCCSVCNTEALWKDEGGIGGFSHGYVGAKSRRCPECGAKMDEAENGTGQK